MDSSFPYLPLDTVVYSRENPPSDISGNFYTDVAEKFFPIEKLENPRPLKTRSLIKAPIPSISTNPIFLDISPHELPKENSVEDLQANEYTAFFVMPHALYEEVEKTIRTPLKSSCDSLFPYAYHVSRALRESCITRIFLWGRQTVSSIIRELIAPLELKGLAQNSLSEARMYRKKLEELCKEKPNLLKTPFLTTALLKHLPLTIIAQAKVEASIFCLLPRFIRHLSPYENFPVISCMEHAKNEIQKLDLSLIRELDLSRSYIEVLPFAIAKRLINIRKLDFSHNKSSSLPLLHSLQKMSSLRELDLSNNRFTSIPLSFFEDLPNLEKIDLRGNLFTSYEVEKIKNYFLERQTNTQVFL